MELLREGGVVPAFTLPDAVTGKPVAWAPFLRARRIVLIVAGGGARDVSGTAAWLAQALGDQKGFAERDLTVIIVAPYAEPNRAHPAHFLFLRDETGQVSRHLGGTPAFYLVGKDTHIAWATRDLPPNRELFGRIDAMPMRRAEMRRGVYRGRPV